MPLPGRRALELPAHLRRAGEGDHRDVGVVVPGGHDLGRPARDDVQPARRQAGLGQGLGQQPGGERCPLRRLEDHRTAGGQGGSDLVQHQVEREVERRDRGDDSERLRVGEPERDHPGSHFVELYGLRRQPPGLLGGDPQRADGAGDFDQGRRDRLAGFGPQQLGEVGRPLGDQLGGLQQHVSPGRGRPTGEHRRLGRRDRLRGLVRAGDGDGADQRLVVRIVHLEGVDTVHPLAVDEELLVTHVWSLLQRAGPRWPP